MLGDNVFTSESVSESHPDKLADCIADAVVDAFFAADPMSHVGCETLCTTNYVVLAGEARGPASVTREKLCDIARGVIREVGYEQEGFHWQNAEIACRIHSQSPGIAWGGGRCREQR